MWNTLNKKVFWTTENTLMKQKKTMHLALWTSKFINVSVSGRYWSMVQHCNIRYTPTLICPILSFLFSFLPLQQHITIFQKVYRFRLRQNTGLDLIRHELHKTGTHFSNVKNLIHSQILCRSVHFAEYFVYISSTGCISRNFSFMDIGTSLLPTAWKDIRQHMFFSIILSNQSMLGIQQRTSPTLLAQTKQKLSDLGFSKQCCREVFWDVMLCHWLSALWSLQNTWNHSPNNTMSHPIRPESSIQKLFR